MYSSMVRKMFDALGGRFKDVFRYKALVDKGGFLDTTTKKPTTVKAYLCALRQYFTFEKTNNNVIEVSTCVKAIENCQRWIRATRQEVSAQRHQLIESEQAVIPQVAKSLVDYDSTKHRRDAIMLLHTLRGDPKTVPSTRDFLQIRDYLMIELMRQNGQRTGPIINSTIDDFDVANKIDDGYILKVKEHKTSKSHGSARLCLSPEIYVEMKTWIAARRRYLKKRRSGGGGGGEHLFCCTSGKRMHSSRVSQVLKSVLGCCTINPTKIRKAHYLIQRKRGASKSELAEMAKHMTHSSQTADTWYDASDRDVNTAKVSGKMWRSMRAARKDTEVVCILICLLRNKKTRVRTFYDVCVCVYVYVFSFFPPKY